MRQPLAGFPSNPDGEDEKKAGTGRPAPAFSGFEACDPRLRHPIC
ncbi:hypothetical protein SFOMI_2535 [Sphingobium fuliginis]|uniref:Uncharacterized protein n=1 Tax=Sphingobium fuliginis (strain ATCC 27551) TaxID=336203 RepID=A0A292ZB96_SPHSA|nr:hypothetical protein SFOMI_2535 [Sphingobium fuliginis]